MCQHTIRKNIFGLAILFTLTISSNKVYAQDFSLEILDAQGDYGIKEMQGFVTKLDLPYADVKKAWWKYVRRIALITNKKTHYENRILAKKSQAETDIYFFSYIDQDGDDNYIYAAIDRKQTSEKYLKKYESYLKNLMLDFKVNLFSKYMQDRIDLREKKSERISLKLERLEKQNEKLEASKDKKNANPSEIKQRIKDNKKEIEQYRKELFAYQSEVDRLKKELKKIK